MKTLLIAASALALASPALAQTTGTTGGATTTTTTVPPPPPAPPPAADPMTTPGTTTGVTAAPVPTDPKAVIATEFPTYDKDGNGSLDTAEFDSWMVALKDKAGGPAEKPAARTAWLKGAFASADKDKNKVVSQTELTTYLTAGA